jgi:hypothetical protein
MDFFKYFWSVAGSITDVEPMDTEVDCTHIGLSQSQIHFDMQHTILSIVSMLNKYVLYVHASFTLHNI